MTDWTAPTRRAPTAVTTDKDHDLFEVVELIKRLPPEYFNDRDKWFRVGAVLYGLFPTAGLELFKRFSQQSQKYKPGDCENLWPQYESYDGNRPGFASLKLWATVEPKAERPFELYALDHLLMGDFRVTYLIDGLLVAGQPCLCVGPQKCLKTTLLLKMALCLASGTRFLGRECQKRRVLFMSGESGMATLQETALRIIKALGVTPENGHFYITPDLPQFSQPLEKLEQLLVDQGTEVLIIDPAYLCLDGSDANNMFVMGQQLGSVANLCTKLGVTLVLAHHTTKAAGKENKPLELSDMAWSGFGEFARQWLMISRRESYVDGTGEHKLFLRAGGSAGHSNLLHLHVREGVFPNRFWEVDVRTSGEVSRDRAEEKYLSMVERIRENVTEPIHKTKIRDAAGIKSKDWPSAFDRMLDEGILVESETIKGRPTYRLK